MMGSHPSDYYKADTFYISVTHAHTYPVTPTPDPIYNSKIKAQ